MKPLPQSFLIRPIAHRALHDRKAGRPENSLEAVRAAVEAGYGIEIDIQPSSDGVPMVFHDYDLDRLTGETGPVRDRTAAELGAIRLKDGQSGIPTFAEVLAAIDGRVPLLVEIKDQDGKMGPDVGPLESAVAGVLAGYRGPVAVMSFNPHSVIAFGKAAPEVPRGLTTSAYKEDDWKELPPEVCRRLRDIPDLAPSGASFISHEAADLARGLVGRLRAGGLPILCWTIRSPAQDAEARRYADNVTFEGYLPHVPAA